MSNNQEKTNKDVLEAAADQLKPFVDKASLEASKKQHEKAINNNQNVIKDGKDTGRPKG